MSHQSVDMNDNCFKSNLTGIHYTRDWKRAAVPLLRVFELKWVCRIWENASFHLTYGDTQHLNNETHRTFVDEVSEAFIASLLSNQKVDLRCFNEPINFGF